MAESSPSGKKTLREKVNLLLTSNFSFSHSVFKRLVLQTRKNQGWFGKGLKALADNNLKIIESVFVRVENIVGKGENAGYQHFLLFPQCFPKDSTSRVLKFGNVW